jgi:Icc-related predicted phosphoesterase
LEIQEKWDLIPTDTDVLITHQPPFNILDLAWSKKYNNTEKCPHCGEIHKSFQHWGDPKLKKKIQEIKPKYHLFGHGKNSFFLIKVHDSAGFKEIGETIYVNSSWDLDKIPSVFEISNE